MLAVNKFRKVFTYILMDYCEETCTAQNELYNIVLIEPDLEKLINLFAEEGFMEWWPKDIFHCIEITDEAIQSTYFDPDDEDTLPCFEKYWKSICDKTDISFDDFLATI